MLKVIKLLNRKLVNRRSMSLFLFLLVVYMTTSDYTNHTSSVNRERNESDADYLTEKAEEEKVGWKNNLENKVSEQLESTSLLEHELGSTEGEVLEEMKKAQHGESQIAEEKLTQNSKAVQNDAEGYEDIKESKIVRIKDELKIKFPDAKNESGDNENDKKLNMNLKIVEDIRSEQKLQKHSQSKEVKSDIKKEEKAEKDSQQRPVNIMEEKQVPQTIYKDKHENVEDVLQKMRIQSLNNNDQRTDKQQTYNAVDGTNGTFSPNILLLATMGRSGSSFLGGLLSSQNQVFYIFEPFYDIQKKHLLTKQTVANALRSIFTCDINEQLTSFFLSKPRFAIKQYIKECSGSTQTCLQRKSLNAACRKKDIRVVKTIRTRVSWLDSILRDAKVNMKVIHLIRDPRATVISSWKRGWSTSPSTACENYDDDLKNGLILSNIHPDKYIAVRYEDLCDDPWGLANYIFKFLGYKTLPESTIRFLKSSISDKHESSAFSIKRNTKRMQQKWRSSITEQQLKQIESVCASTITHLGFHLFNSINDVRNYSLPLYNDKYVNKLFKYDDAS